MDNNNANPPCWLLNDSTNNSYISLGRGRQRNLPAWMTTTTQNTTTIPESYPTYYQSLTDHHYMPAATTTTTTTTQTTPTSYSMMQRHHQQHQQPHNAPLLSSRLKISYDYSTQQRPGEAYTSVTRSDGRGYAISSSSTKTATENKEDNMTTTESSQIYDSYTKKPSATSSFNEYGYFFSERKSDNMDHQQCTEGLDNTVKSNSWHTASFEDPTIQVSSFITPAIFKTTGEYTATFEDTNVQVNFFTPAIFKTTGEHTATFEDTTVQVNSFSTPAIFKTTGEHTASLEDTTVKVSSFITPAIFKTTGEEEDDMDIDTTVQVSSCIIPAIFKTTGEHTASLVDAIFKTTGEHTASLVDPTVQVSIFITPAAFKATGEEDDMDIEESDTEEQPPQQQQQQQQQHKEEEALLKLKEEEALVQLKEEELLLQQKEEEALLHQKEEEALLKQKEEKAGIEYVIDWESRDLVYKKLGKRKKKKFTWTRIIQNAATTCTEFYLHRVLQELAAQTRTKGYLIRLLPLVHNLFIKFCVEHLKACSSLEAQEIFNFLSAFREQEENWCGALANHHCYQPLNGTLHRLIEYARRGILCPRNKVDFHHFLHFCFESTDDVIDQIYNYLTTNIPQFTIRQPPQKPWNKMSSLHEKCRYFHKWQQKEKWPFIIEHIPLSTVPLSFQPLVSKLQFEAKQYDYPLHTGLNKCKFERYCKTPEQNTNKLLVTQVYHYLHEQLAKYESCSGGDALFVMMQHNNGQNIIQAQETASQKHLQEPCLPTTNSDHGTTNQQQETVASSPLEASIAAKGEKVLQPLIAIRKSTKSYDDETICTNTTAMEESDSSCTEEKQGVDNHEGIASHTATNIIIDQKEKRKRRKLGKRKRANIWTHAIQNSINSDCIPESIKNLLAELAAWARINMDRIPKSQELFCETIMSKFKASQFQSEETYRFLYCYFNSELSWNTALHNHVPLQSVPASLKQLIVELTLGKPCPRNKSYFFHFMHFEYKVRDKVTCSQAYDYLATHIPEFTHIPVFTEMQQQEQLHTAVALVDNDDPGAANLRAEKKLVECGPLSNTLDPVTQSDKETNSSTQLEECGLMSDTLDPVSQSDKDTNSSNVALLLSEPSIAAKRERVLQSMRQAKEEPADGDDRNSSEQEARYKVLKSLKRNLLTTQRSVLRRNESQHIPVNCQSLVAYKTLPKEITALSQRILIENISKSGPPERIRFIKEAASTKSDINTKVGNPEHTEAVLKRKYACFAGSGAEESHKVWPPSPDEQAKDARKRSEELQKNLASLKKRLKEKQEKKLLQSDPKGGEVSLHVDVSSLQGSMALQSSGGKDGFLGDLVSQNVSDNAGLEGSNGASDLSSFKSLRMRQKQLRQTIELSNLKNIASKQKNLFSEQNLRLKESKQLFDECSAEVKTYGNLVQEREKRLAEFERRQKMLLGMLTKATKNVLDARRILNEAKQSKVRHAL